MKKILALIALLVFSNCDVKVSPREVTAQSAKDIFYNGGGLAPAYQFHTEERCGMLYGVWSLENGGRYTSHHTGYPVAVVNLTKDALEVELLRLQIAKALK